MTTVWVVWGTNAELVLIPAPDGSQNSPSVGPKTKQIVASKGNSHLKKKSLGCNINIFRSSARHKSLKIHLKFDVTSEKYGDNREAISSLFAPRYL